MCQQCPPNVSQAAVEEFGGKLLGMLNQAGLALMVSIGHRTGLFDALAGQPPMSCADVATRANLNERYVREWLGAMVTGGLVEYSAEATHYQLPDTHAALLTRAAAPDNFATTMQWISVLGSVEDQIVDCFAEGGGVHYDAFARFHDVMAEESAQTVVAALVDHILPAVPDLEARLRAGIDVCDIGCGAGRALVALAKQFPASRFTGYDFSSQAITKGQAEAQAAGLENLHFAVQDVAQIEDVDAFDLVTAFDSIHDQRDPAGVLAKIHQAVRSTGSFLMQDITSSSHLENNVERPIAPFLYTISTMHCMTVSLAQGGAGLGTCWGEELAEEMLREAGFAAVKLMHLPHDIMNSYYVATP